MVLESSNLSVFGLLGWGLKNKFWPLAGWVMLGALFSSLALPTIEAFLESIVNLASGVSDQQGEVSLYIGVQFNFYFGFYTHDFLPGKYDAMSVVSTLFYAWFWLLFTRIGVQALKAEPWSLKSARAISLSSYLYSILVLVFAQVCLVAMGTLMSNFLIFMAQRLGGIVVIGPFSSVFIFSTLIYVLLFAPLIVFMALCFGSITESSGEENVLKAIIRTIKNHAAMLARLCGLIFLIIIFGFWVTTAIGHQINLNARPQDVQNTAWLINILLVFFPGYLFAVLCTLLPGAIYMSTDNAQGLGKNTHHIFE